MQYSKRLHERKIRALLGSRLSQTEVSQAVQLLAAKLGVPQGIFSGPITKGQLPLDNIPSYRLERLQYDFLSKYQGFSWGNPRDVAIESFRRSEFECFQTNQRVRRFMMVGPDPSFRDLDEVVRRTRTMIHHVLGRFRWEDLLPRGGFGPGVTSSTKGAFLHNSRKFGSKPDVSPSFAKMGMKLVSSLPSWADLLVGVDFPTWVTPLPNVIPGNAISFVPKNAKTDRCIAIEPTVNIFFQKAAGSLIRERLRSAGLDLNSQATNQALARLGSIDDTLSTIDLERASDTLSRRVVELLLPDDWFAALNMMRSQFGFGPFIDDSFCWRPYEKFSSMGNGFTFELESLIFWALSTSVAEMDGYNPFWVTSYGDDVIVPSGVYNKVVETFAWFGFTVNREKSFSQGPFRESCGMDYIRGCQVRPVYLKEVPVSVLHWIRLANSLKRLAHQWAGFSGLDMRLKDAYDFCLSMIPAPVRRLSVSDGYGDVALIRDLDEAHPTRAKNGLEGWITSVILSKPVTAFSRDRSLITAGTHQPGQQGNELPLRGKVELTIGPMLISEWRNLGSWV